MARPRKHSANKPDDADEAMSWVVDKVHDLRRSIQKATGKVEEVWFGNLLLGILNCASLDYYSAKVGAEKSVYLAAWACRNLAELRVITTYILASKTNASNFRDELVIDAKEFYEAMSRHHQSTHGELLSLLSEMSAQEKGQVKEMLDQVLRRERAQGPNSTATDSEAAGYKYLMADFGFKEKARPKTVREIARLVNRSENFDPIFKICSKIMHRTVFSIASTITQESLDAAIPALANHAAIEFLAIHGLIDGHFKKRDIRPPA
jgi:hypothetical protein